MFESLRFVYYPTNAVTESNSLSWLMMMRGISEQLSIATEDVYAHPDGISIHRFIDPSPSCGPKQTLFLTLVVKWGTPKLGLQKQRNVIDRREVMDAKYLFLRDMEEYGYLVFVAELSRWRINSLPAI